MLCCVFNYPSHYRTPIFNEMSKELDVHFYFCKRLRNETIKKIDLPHLKGFKKEMNVNFFSFPILWEWWAGMIFLAFNKKYDKYLITPNYFAPNQWVFLILCKLFSKKVYSWEHGLTRKEIHPLWLFVDRLFHSLLSGSFIYGNKARNIMIDFGYDETKLHVIYNSLDYDSSLKYRKKLNEEPIYVEHFNNEDPTLLFIGRITQIKKLDMVIDAHDVLMKKGIKTNVVLIGDGEILTVLKQLVSNKGYSDRFWFYGSLFNENEIARLLYNATICISPGNVGLTAIHAFSYGLPVITNNNFQTQMPEHEIIEDGINGLFFEENSIVSLAEKIEVWLTTKNNRQGIRLSCYKPVDTYFNPYYQLNLLKKVIYNK